MTRSLRHCIITLVAVTFVVSACDGDDTETPPRTSETPPVEDAAPGASIGLADESITTTGALAA